MSPTRKNLVICHLYPELMNMYGDRGNVIALARRIAWHGMECRVEGASIGAVDMAGFDIVFLGGGQDREQKQICVDLKDAKGGRLRDAVEAGVPFLAICGGYQLLGKHYRTASGQVMDGVGILDCWTDAGETRLIGNVVLESRISGSPRTVVGFENHSGKTFLGEMAEPFGRVLNGFGNNGEDRLEGAVYKNTIGTYLHGSLLPKNPWLADWLIDRALQRKYGEQLSSRLDDSIENMAHEAAIKRVSRRTV